MPAMIGQNGHAKLSGAALALILIVMAAWAMLAFIPTSTPKQDPLQTGFVVLEAVKGAANRAIQSPEALVLELASEKPETRESLNSGAMPTGQNQKTASGKSFGGGSSGGGFSSGAAQPSPVPAAPESGTGEEGCSPRPRFRIRRHKQSPCMAFPMEAKPAPRVSESAWRDGGADGSYSLW